MQKRNSNRPGGITLMMVFATTLIAFLLVFEGYASAMHEQVISHNDYETEKAFYAAQTCLEEGFLKLKTDANYAGTTISMGDLQCSVITQHEPNATSGKLAVIGTFGQKIRNVEAVYADAGPTTTRTQTSIFHILDKSGSMKDDGWHCTDPAYATQADCTAHAAVWGLQPITTAKEAAKTFVNRLDATYDKIGVIAYNEPSTVVKPLTNQFASVNTAINSINAEDFWTNIGDAIQLATTQLSAEPSTRTRVELLLTDGQANRPLPADTAAAYALQKATAAKQQGMLIFTIGLGNQVNPEFLRQVSSVVNGQQMYFYAPSASDLNDIYNRIADIIIAYNISQQQWQEQ